MRHPLIVLTGPTASGKSQIALDWARRTRGWILSCDSLLFYRGADIGTAKPTPAEREEIPHFGMDLCDPREVFDLPRYIAHAKETLEAADRKGVPVLVAGGSGFYTSAFHAPAPDPVDIPPHIRERVTNLEAAGGVERLREALLAIDPDPDVDLRNRRRIAPALERCLATGLTTRELRERQKALPCPFAHWERIWLRVDRPDAELRDRIQLRTDRMLTAGLIEEVAVLRRAGMEKNPTLASAIGYRETLAFLAGEMDRFALGPTIAKHTEQLASRQKRWIRNRLPECRPIRGAKEIIS